jgi:hypothetical protein
MLQEDQKIQRGIFSFLTKQALSIAGMHQILMIYAQSKDMIRPKKNRLKWYSEVSHLANNDFPAFKSLYNKNKKNLSYDNSQSYNDWWNECNLDGSFAYNGVTEDF